MLCRCSDCTVDVRVSAAKRVKRDTDSSAPADETTAERRQRIETAQQEAIAQQQQQLLDTTPDEPTPAPVLPQQLPMEAEEPTGQENVPPPSSVRVKAGKSDKPKANAARKGKKTKADGADESEAESTAAASDIEPATTASEREEDEVETGKRKRTRGNKAVDDHVDSAVKVTKKATRPRATKKTADDRPADVEEGRTTRTRAAAKRAEADKDKEKVKEREAVEPPQTKKPKKTAATKKKREAEPPSPAEDDNTAAAVEPLTEEVVIVQQVESVVDVLDVVEKEDRVTVMEWTKDEQSSFVSNTTSSSNVTEAAIESLLEDEVADDQPLSAQLPAQKPAAEYLSLSTIIPPTIPLSPPPVPSPTSSAWLSAADDKPAEPFRSAGLVSWLKAPFSLLGIGGGSAMKKETLPLASVTPGAMLAGALMSSPSTTPATSPVPSPTSSPVLRSISAPDDAVPHPLISSAQLPPPLPMSAPGAGATAESAAAANAKSRKEELKAKLEASKQQMKDKIEEARALGSGGSNHSGSATTTPTSGAALSSVSLGATQEDGVEVIISRQTAEHIQVIDIVEQTVTVTESTISEVHSQQSQREEGSHFIVAPTTIVSSLDAYKSDSTATATDITLLSSPNDVTIIEQDDVANDDTADIAMADDGETKRDDRAEATTKAKGGKADTLKKKDAKEKQLEAARKREEVDRRRRQLEETERRKQEEKEEERRKKDEQLKRAKQQQATDKKKAATLKPAAAAYATAANKTAAASTKKKDDRKEIAKTLPLPITWTAGGATGSRSATLPEPVSIVELGSSVSYTGKEEKEGEEEAMDDDDDDERKYAGEEEKESVVTLSTYAPLHSQPTQSTLSRSLVLDMNPPPLPPLPIAFKGMPPPPLPMKPTHTTTQPPPTPQFVPLVKFHRPNATNTAVENGHPIISAPLVLPPKPYQLTLTIGQTAATDSSMSPPPARVPHDKTPPQVHNSTAHTMPPHPLPVLHTPEHGKLLPPHQSSTLHPPTTSTATTSSSSSTPQQPKPKTSPQSYIFSPPPKPLTSPDSNNYPMSDHDASDCSDEESSSAKKRDARIPSWAKEPQLSHALRAQLVAAVDPDSIFPPIDPFSMSLHDIFKGYKRKRSFRERTSSGNWHLDQLSVREEMQYKRDMGYIRATADTTTVTAATSTASPTAATVIG